MESLQHAETLEGKVFCVCRSGQQSTPCRYVPLVPSEQSMLLLLLLLPERLATMNSTACMLMHDGWVSYELPEARSICPGGGPLAPQLLPEPALSAAAPSSSCASWPWHQSGGRPCVEI